MSIIQDKRFKHLPQGMRKRLHKMMGKVEGRDPCWSTADLLYELLFPRLYHKRRLRRATRAIS